MKLICNGNDLAEALGKVIKAVSSKSLNPILEGVFMKAVHGSLTLIASDSELTIERTFPADVKIEGETVVPARLFGDFIRRLTKEQIELTLTDKRTLRIKYAFSEGSMQCLAPEDFPKPLSFDEGKSFSIARSEFKDMVNKTAFSACISDTRPLLKGVYLDITPQKVMAVAVDGYRLAKCYKPIESALDNITIIAPARSLMEIARLIEDGEQPLTMTIENNHLKLDLEHTRIITQLIDGEYVSFNKIIPEFFASEVTVSRHQFEESLERAVLLSRQEKSNLVRFDITSDTLKISSNSEAGKIEEKLAIKLKGKEITIAFNAKYFLDLLKNITEESLTIKFTTPITPCTVEPATPTKDVLYLILPVRLN